MARRAHIDRVRTVDTAETHVSWLFFLGDRAYKLKKPVRLGFLDFSTVERRRAACEREVELNRRLAPDVYRGMATVLDEHGQVCDHLVVMERMPDDRRLARTLAAECVSAVARRMAAFHDGAVRSADIDRQGTPTAVWEKWDANTQGRDGQAARRGVTPSP